MTGMEEQGGGCGGEEPEQLEVVPAEVRETAGGGSTFGSEEGGDQDFRWD